MNVIKALLTEYADTNVINSTEYKIAANERDRLFSNLQKTCLFDLDKFNEYDEACSSVTLIEIEEAFLAGIRAAMKLISI